MYNRRYDKCFIMLRQEFSGYSDGRQQTSGSSTIELKNGKGRLTTYVQGLKRLSGTFYYIYLINGNAKRSLGVKAGMIEVDNNGRGSQKWDFEPDNVGGSGIPIDDFNAIAVICRGSTANNTSIIAPLSGYKNDKFNWKSGFVEYGGEREPEKKEREKKSSGLTFQFQEPVFACEKKSGPEEALAEKDGDLEALSQEKAAAESRGSAEGAAEAEKYTEQTEDTVLARETSDSTDAENDLPETSMEKISMERADKEEEPQASMERADKEEKTEASMERDDQSEEDAVGEDIEEFPSVQAENGCMEEGSADGAKISETGEGTVYATEKDFYGDFQMTEGESPHNTFREITKRFKKELEELEQIGVLTPEEVSRIQNKGDSPGNKKGPITDIDYIFRNNTRANPFETRDDCEWVSICVDEIPLTPVQNYRIMSHPFVLSSYRKYKHLLFGRKKDGEKTSYVLGVPDVYSAEYKLMASRLGFQRFMGCGGQNPSEGCYGYWLMDMIG